MHQARIGDSQATYSTEDRLAGRIRIGCSGWYYWHWKGKFYPADIPSNQYFRIYQDHFETVELNAPFYSWPTIGAVKTWIRQADPGFVYTIKVCELITHIRRFEDTKSLIEDFGYIADLLGPQMGCFLFQLPPSVRYTSEMLQSKRHTIVRRTLIFSNIWQNCETVRDKSFLCAACARLPGNLLSVKLGSSKNGPVGSTM
ncbi:DUF72 domain-containing protein [Rhizobium leguminosarum]|uniref:DUF72 domain-containing protein n=1 Tax=Rhizobium leguminosarum TaxID=384 RepID=UPI001C96980E|nr:DUF72 domain-containing protein [Rhizobium leguminosarum]MBY5678318.1 DUF72 domain-containing protein [Rhizobium leguminosarum]